MARDALRTAVPVKTDPVYIVGSTLSSDSKDEILRFLLESFEKTGHKLLNRELAKRKRSLAQLITSTN